MISTFSSEPWWKLKEPGVVSQGLWASRSSPFRPCTEYEITNHACYSDSRCVFQNGYNRCPHLSQDMWTLSWYTLSLKDKMFGVQMQRYFPMTKILLHPLLSKVENSHSSPLPPFPPFFFNFKGRSQFSVSSTFRYYKWNVKYPQVKRFSVKGILKNHIPTGMEFWGTGDWY